MEFNVDCKTVRIFAYSSTREQSNKRSGTRLKTESETGAFEARALRARKTLTPRFTDFFTDFVIVLQSKFNAKKCKVLRAARIRSIDDRDYYLGWIKLDRVDVEKDPGVLVSHNLSWNNHVDLISSQAQKCA